MVHFSGGTSGVTVGLTDTEIRKAKGAERPYRMADGGNLYLWVTPSGGKLWRWGYRFDGKQKLMTFGKYPDVPLARARERHAQQRAILADGVDPMARKKAIKIAVKLSSENSFASVAALWVEHLAARKEPAPRRFDSAASRGGHFALPGLTSHS